jgi:hypothetical protein
VAADELTEIDDAQARFSELGHCSTQSLRAQLSTQRLASPDRTGASGAEFVAFSASRSRERPSPRPTGGNSVFAPKSEHSERLEDPAGWAVGSGQPGEFSLSPQLILSLPG